MDNYDNFQIEYWKAIKNNNPQMAELINRELQSTIKKESINKKNNLIKSSQIKEAQKIIEDINGIENKLSFFIEKDPTDSTKCALNLLEATTKERNNIIKYSSNKKSDLYKMVISSNEDLERDLIESNDPRENLVDFSMSLNLLRSSLLNRIDKIN